MSTEYYITAQTYYSTEYQAYLRVSKSDLEKFTKIFKFLLKYKGHIIDILSKDEFLDKMDECFYSKKWQDEIKEEKFDLQC